VAAHAHATAAVWHRSTPCSRVARGGKRAGEADKLPDFLPERQLLYEDQTNRWATIGVRFGLKMTPMYGPAVRRKRFSAISVQFLCSCHEAVSSSRPAHIPGIARKGRQGWPSRLAFHHTGVWRQTGLFAARRTWLRASQFAALIGL
jgi:hypothetical protein